MGEITLARQWIRARSRVAVVSVRFRIFIVTAASVALACLVSAGRYDIVLSDASVRTAAVSGSIPHSRHSRRRRDVQVTLTVDAGDRLIISSLDERVRLHEVLISQSVHATKEHRTQRDQYPPAVDIAVTQSCRVICNTGGLTNGDPQFVNTGETRTGYHPASLATRQNRDTGAGTSELGNGSSIVTLRRLFPAASAARGESEDTDRTLVNSPVSAPRERVFRLPQFLPDSVKGVVTPYDLNRVSVCRLVTRSSQLAIYTSGPVLSDQTADDLVAIIQNVLLPAVIQQVGPVTDIDGDDRLSVVMCDLSVPVPVTESPLLGCVHAPDFLVDGPLHGDIIYLDHRLPASSVLPAIVLHELTHAAVFSRLRRLRQDGHNVGHFPIWLNEAIAHSCEYQMYPESPNLTARISAYLQCPGQWPLMYSENPASQLSRRGAVRAAGLFYVHFVRQTATLPDLIDRELQLQCPADQRRKEKFAKSFRRWTVWMSDCEQTGQLPLRIRSLFDASRTHQVLVRGTAATWWHCKEHAVIKVSAGHHCALQITIVKPATNTPLSETTTKDGGSYTE